MGRSSSSYRIAIRTAVHETIGYSPFFVNFGREHKISGQEHRHRLAEEETAESLPNMVKRRQQGFQDMFAKISSRLKTAHEKNKRTYDLRRRPVSYNVGDKVWRKNKTLSDATIGYTAKLAPKYLGPFNIRKKIGYCTYQLMDENGSSCGTWHAQELKPYFEPP